MFERSLINVSLEGSVLFNENEPGDDVFFFILCHGYRSPCVCVRVWMHLDACARVREFEKWSAEATTNHITRGIYSVLAHGLRPSQRLVRLLIIAHRASIERSDSFWPKGETLRFGV